MIIFDIVFMVFCFVMTFGWAAEEIWNHDRTWIAAITPFAFAAMWIRLLYVVMG